jgi:hypothetical protein
MYTQRVDVERQTLCLAPLSHEGKTVLARTTDAIRLCRDCGYAELHGGRAWEQLDALRRQDMGRVRDFISSIRLAGFPLSSLDDAAVLATLRGAIRNHEVVLLRKGAKAPTGSRRTTPELRQLIKKIESQTGRSFHYAGRSYRLVADVDLSKLPNRDHYEVSSQADAVVVLDAVAQQAATNAGLVALLAEARAKLTADWSPPRQPEGLVLLKRIAVAASVASSTGSALTPSQLKRQFEEVAPVMDGSTVELDLAEVELPVEDAAAEDTEDSVAEADTSEASDDSPDDGVA